MSKPLRQYKFINEGKQPSQPTDELAKLAQCLTDTVNLFRKQAGHTAGHTNYYREQYALEVKRVLDHVLTTGEPMFVSMEHLRISTFKNKWYQALNYLLHQMDPKSYYRSGMERLTVRFQKSRGLSVRPVAVAGCLKDFTTEDWIVKLTEFLATSSPNDKFERRGIPLTQENIDWVLEQLSPIREQFLYQVDATGILIIHYASEHDGNLRTKA